MLLDYSNIVKKKNLVSKAKLTPPDIEYLINSLEEIKRFDHKQYPKGVIEDNVKDHTLKCISLVQFFVPKTHKDFSKILRTLWIHDIPELFTGDLTTLEKISNKDLFQIFDTHEVEVAERILSNEDMKLYKSFNTANLFIKDRTDSAQGITEASLIAKIIDNAEGNLTYHHSLTNWLSTDGSNIDLLPPEESLMRASTINQRFLERVGNLDKINTKIAKSISQAVLETINLMWSKVPTSKIPQPLQ